jgi:hypothetical protein
MAAFFVPPHPGGAPATEPTYRRLRDEAEARTGVVSRERRIEAVLCRRSGRDCQLRVGELDTANGQTVMAIIQLGRGTYTVHHLGLGSAAPPDPLVLQRSEVYTVTEFHQPSASALARAAAVESGQSPGGG